MKKFSSSLVITNSGLPLANGIISTENDGTIISVDNTLNNGMRPDFYEGIIVPGFINCHCHLEISHLKGAIKGGKGLADFIGEIRNIRDVEREKITEEAEKADKQLYDEGVVVCADICNTDFTFRLKTQSDIKYFNLLEIFGIDPAKTEKRISELNILENQARKYGLDYSVTPHSVYSVSLPLFRYLREKTDRNRITSIHFLESDEEQKFIYDHSGPIKDSYLNSGIMPENPETVSDHAGAILNEITPSGNLILVHNTFADSEIIEVVKRRKNTWWCLCPGSNKYISGRIPPADLMLSHGCNMVIGTDSLASNSTLSIISELKILQEHFPEISLTEMIRWATINGARALLSEESCGSIEPGKKPGLLLLVNADIENLRLLPDTYVKRLI